MVVCTKKLLVLKRSTRFGGFSQNAIVFATFCLKFAQNPKTWYFAQKVYSFEEIEKFLRFFYKQKTAYEM